jgi:hypothetical protein
MDLRKTIIRKNNDYLLVPAIEIKKQNISIVFESQELFLNQLKRNTRSHWSIQSPFQVDAYIILSRMFL